MRLNRWIVLPAAGIAAVIIGVAAVEAAPSPSASPTASKNYAQTFIDKLAGILHLTPTQTTDALKQAQLQTVDQMLKDGQITQQQADAMKARINAGQGLVFGFGGRHGSGGGFGGFKANGALMQSLTTAELNAAASALHMSTADLRSALKSGKSLSAIETQQKVSDSAVKTAMKNAAKGVLDNAVKAGTITQVQADAILSRLGSGLKFRGHQQDNESEEAPGGQAPTTPVPTIPTPTPPPSQSPAAYYTTI
jgi:ABC-type transport system involved in cytochrome bd biosynthesis fused ATPase/permease subunit